MASSVEDTCLYIQIPKHRNVESSSGNSYTLYCVEVFNGAQHHIVEKRYREFYKLRNKLKKVIKPHPKFPPKKMAKNVRHVIQVRKRKLERYLNAVAKVEDAELLAELFRFLDVIPIRLTPSLNEIEGSGVVTRWEGIPSVAIPCVETVSTDCMAENIIEGVLSAVYNVM
eukprot:TRINITY_DN8713_c0_g1_i1.p1 TRINITY_DN8713_c0_g1~~TRINITY_DN8713_c0_g1_i1.p1  ORF type:complete len:170 (+),score=38.61 TRINITY_DN8713_c0_g1_i1:14-523(+)